MNTDKRMPLSEKPPSETIYNTPLKFEETVVVFNRFNGNYVAGDGREVKKSGWSIDLGGEKYEFLIPADTELKIKSGRKYLHVELPSEIYLDTGDTAVDGYKILRRLPILVLEAMIREDCAKIGPVTEKRHLDASYLRELESEGLIRRMEGASVSPKGDGITIPKLGDFRREQILIDEEENTVIAMRNSRLCSGNYVLALTEGDSGEVVYYQAEPGVMKKIVEDADPFLDL